MAHRGRLNVLVNIARQDAGTCSPNSKASRRQTTCRRGDVKYHQGFSTDVIDRRRPGPPVAGVQPVAPRNRQPGGRRLGQRAAWTAAATRAAQVLPVMIHGDAAFAGQGVVMETLNLAQTRGYGTRRHAAHRHQQPDRLHDLGSARLALDAVLHRRRQDDRGAGAARERRRPRGRRPVQRSSRSTTGRQFNKDVVVDIVCFRKLGHNEQDTPAVTQPLMYKTIAEAPGHAQALRRQAGRAGRHAADGADEMVKATRAALDAGKSSYDPVLTNYKSKYAVDWNPFLGKKWTDAADTALPLAELKRLAERITTVPARLQGPSAGREGARRPRRDGPRRGAGRLGHGRAPRLRVAGRERLRGAPVGPGLGARHVHAPSRRPARPEPRALGRGHVHAAPARRRRPGEVRRHRLAAVRGGGARLRVRLRERRAEHARHLGSAVRRLRQRRAGRHRPVHRLGRSEVGPRQRPDADAAARLRGPGAGALVGAPRALHAALGRQQHAGRAADLARARSSTSCAGRWCACSGSR